MDFSMMLLYFRYCREYATLRENEVIRTVVVCDGDSPQKHIYITDSNYVEIEVEKFGQNDISYRFLMRYEGKISIHNRLR